MKRNIHDNGASIMHSVPQELLKQRIVRDWHARCQNWDLVLSQLEIMFADRKVG